MVELKNPITTTQLEEIISKIAKRMGVMLDTDRTFKMRSGKIVTEKIIFYLNHCESKCRESGRAFAHITGVYCSKDDDIRHHLTLDTVTTGKAANEAKYNRLQIDTFPCACDKYKFAEEKLIKYLESA